MGPVLTARDADSALADPQCHRPRLAQPCTHPPMMVSLVVGGSATAPVVSPNWLVGSIADATTIKHAIAVVFAQATQRDTAEDRILSDVLVRKIAKMEHAREGR
jgi:hypothetical protein